MAPQKLTYNRLTGKGSRLALEGDLGVVVETRVLVAARAVDVADLDVAVGVEDRLRHRHAVACLALKLRVTQ